jgi:hypothetical protein
MYLPLALDGYYYNWIFYSYRLNVKSERSDKCSDCAMNRTVVKGQMLSSAQMINRSQIQFPRTTFSAYSELYCVQVWSFKPPADVLWSAFLYYMYSAHVFRNFSWRITLTLHFVLFFNFKLFNAVTLHGLSTSLLPWKRVRLFLRDWKTSFRDRFSLNSHMSIKLLTHTLVCPRDQRAGVQGRGGEIN